MQKFRRVLQARLAKCRYVPYPSVLTGFRAGNLCCSHTAWAVIAKGPLATKQTLTASEHSWTGFSLFGMLIPSGPALSLPQQHRVLANWYQLVPLVITGTLAGCSSSRPRTSKATENVGLDPAHYYYTVCVGQVEKRGYLVVHEGSYDWCSWLGLYGKAVSYSTAAVSILLHRQHCKHAHCYI